MAKTHVPDDDMGTDSELEESPDDWDEVEDDIDELDDLDDLGEDDDLDEDDGDDTDDEDDDDGDGDGDGEDEEALDELEAEELDMLTDDESEETLVVDEAAELRAIRRAEIAMERDPGTERSLDEFLCQGCFLVLKRSQLQDAKRQLCVDCAG